ncbi:MAG: hypothetical protein AB1430_16175 [Pseudomonadota bacterium]
MVRSKPAVKPRLRAAGPHQSAAAASLLRLSRAVERLPTRSALTQWLHRAAQPFVADPA